MNLHNGISVAAISLGVVVTPGPNMMCMVSRSIAQGRRAGVVSLGGVAVGALVFVVVTNLGLTAVLRTVPLLYTFFEIVGAAYPGRLARQAFRSDGASVFAPREMADTPGGPRPAPGLRLRGHPGRRERVRRPGHHHGRGDPVGVPRRAARLAAGTAVRHGIRPRRSRPAAGDVPVVGMTNRQHLPHGTGVQKGAGEAAPRTHTSEPPPHALLPATGH